MLVGTHRCFVFDSAVGQRDCFLGALGGFGFASHLSVAESVRARLGELCDLAVVASVVSEVFALLGAFTYRGLTSKWTVVSARRFKKRH